jgi:hypothetical protein
VELSAEATEMGPAEPSTAIDAGRDRLDATTGARLDAAAPAPDAAEAVFFCEGVLADCDGRPDTPCTDLRFSALHCGGCNMPCANAHGATACSEGSCVPSCNLGYADCDGDLRNGCETSLDSAQDCGACGTVCAAGGGSPLCTATGCGTTCDVSGTWAAEIDFQVSWPAASVISAGSGRVRYWQRLELAASRGGVSGSATSCGTVLPSSRTDLGGGETFAPVHPDALFDVLPPFFAPAMMGMSLSGNVPGSTFTLPTFALPRGITLTNPLADAWPVTAAGVLQADDDRDGEVGFTVAFKTGGGWAYPALDLLRTVRADRAYAADRLIYGASGSLASCVRAVGTANVVSFDTHIMGCHVSGLGPCIGPQSDLLDGNSPRMAPGNGSFSMVRLEAGAGCAEVRAALP